MINKVFIPILITVLGLNYYSSHAVEQIVKENHPDRYANNPMYPTMEDYMGDRIRGHIEDCIRGPIKGILTFLGLLTTEEIYPDRVAYTEIFKHLTIKELESCALVSKKWCKFSSHDDLWKDHEISFRYYDRSWKYFYNEQSGTVGFTRTVDSIKYNWNELSLVFLSNNRPEALGNPADNLLLPADGNYKEKLKEDMVNTRSFIAREYCGKRSKLVMCTFLSSLSIVRLVTNFCCIRGAAKLKWGFEK